MPDKIKLSQRMPMTLSCQYLLLMFKNITGKITVWQNLHYLHKLCCGKRTGKRILVSSNQKKIKVKYCWLIECLQTTVDETGFIQSTGVKKNKVPRKKQCLVPLSPACPRLEANKQKSGPPERRPQDLSKNFPVQWGLEEVLTYFN